MVTSSHVTEMASRSAVAENLMLHANFMALFYKTGVIAECRNGDFRPFFAPVTLNLTRWPSYTNLTRIPWR